jgi:hypothetical protein
MQAKEETLRGDGRLRRMMILFLAVFMRIEPVDRELFTRIFVYGRSGTGAHSPIFTYMLRSGIFLLCLAVTASAEVDFDRQIRPILSDKCYFCHGPDGGDIKGDLQLHSFETATSDREGAGAAIVPGKPDKSLLMERITSTDPDEVMPPPKRHMKISAAEAKVIKQWITEGAKYTELWSFTPLAKEIPVPAKAGDSARNEIDHFVQAKLADSGDTPADPVAARLSGAHRIGPDAGPNRRVQG